MLTGAARPHRIARVIGTALLLVVCTIALFTVIVPLLFGAQSYTVLTGSMRPALEPGTLIAVRPADPADIRVGDVITFQLRSGDPTVATHRVVGLGVDADGERVFTTRGDANDTDDREPVRAVQIRGTLVYAIPWIGHAAVWLTPAVKSAVVAVIGAGAIGWGILALLRDSSRRRHAAAGAAAVVLIAVGCAVGAAPPALASDHRDALQVSTDGRTWSAASDLSLFDSGLRVVPGRDVRARLWLRNAAQEPGRLSLDATWLPADRQDDRDRALAAALRLQHDAPARLEPGAIRAVTLRALLPAGADNATRAGSARLLLSVALSQETTLPRTGSTVPVPLIVVAAALLAAGVVILILRRRR